MADYHPFFARASGRLQQADLFAVRPDPTFENPSFNEASWRILIVRLSPVKDVDRSLPHLFLCDAARRMREDVYVDLTFFPPAADRQLYGEAGIPWLVGCQSLRGVEDFDLVLVSNSFLLELLNLPLLLRHSGLPLESSQRGEGHPLVILGGSNAMASQALISETGDSFVDAVFFGEGEEAVPRLLRELHEQRRLPRRQRLALVARKIPGLWLAGSSPGQTVEKTVLAKPQASLLPWRYPVLNGPEAGTARLQINYGCPASCGFCFEGFDRKPYREVPARELLAQACQLKQRNGCDTLELYSFNFNTHQDIAELLRAANRLFDRVQFKSQRIDILRASPWLIPLQVAADKRSITLGIEGISQRLRAFLNKSLAREDIAMVLRAWMRERIREIKLFYLLIGHETTADLDEFRDFTRQLKTWHRQQNPGLRLVFSCGLLVRMAGTPLRHDRLFLEPEAWKPIIGPVKSACETNGFEFRLAAHWPDYAATQVLAAGGHWLFELLKTLTAEGIGYEEALPPAGWERIRDWLQIHGHWQTAFLGEKPPDYPFPLSFVQTSVTADFLYQQFLKNQAGADTGYCLGSAEKSGRCQACGACVQPAQRKTILTHALRPPSSPR